MGYKFRFQDLEIWKESIKISNELFDIADELEIKKLYRFAEQLRGAGLSVSNNIAEGAGSNSSKDFIHFLNIARRSAFENANILLMLQQRNLISIEKVDSLLERIDILCRQITSFQKAIR